MTRIILQKLIAEKQKPGNNYEVDPEYLVSKRRRKQLSSVLSRVSFLKKLNWNISGTLLRTAISELFCFRVV